MSKSEIEKFFSDEDEKNTELLVEDEDWAEEIEGQLSVDIFEEGGDLIIKAPVAGVKKEDLEVSVTEDMISIRGKREREKKEKMDDYHIHECYWGSFSRTQSLPTQVLADKAEASLKDGLLTIRVPKSSKTKGKLLKIKTD